MSETIVERTPSAYPYPLLIKRLLDNPIRQFPNQGIVYGDFKRQTYRELGERIHRLASGLTGLGVQPGATVAMAVAETAVIGIPDPKWGEQPLALVVEKRGCEMDEARIRAWLQDFVNRGLLSAWGIPDRVVVIESLPKTSVCKLDKKVMRQLYAHPVPKE